MAITTTVAIVAGAIGLFAVISIVIILVKDEVEADFCSLVKIKGKNNKKKK